MRTLLALSIAILVASSGCGGDDDPAGADGDVGGDPDAGGSTNDCLLTANTSATETESPSGCFVLDRDASGCEADRTAAGLSGYWLELSCRVELSATTDGGDSFVRARADGLPDYESNYWDDSDPCWEDHDPENPNQIAAKDYTIDFPEAADTTSTSMQMIAVVGLSANGVPIFGNFAAPGDDIFTEAQTFDRCGGHPTQNGTYHYHSEPVSLSYDDDRFIGVMRDGYPIYGRRDLDGSLPTVDEYGGHTGTTPHSPSTAVYHYHVNEQTSTNPGTAGEKQWFLTTGTFRGAPGPCTGCN
jgi:hypothetical protein